jgi:hypothetical protein
MLLMSVGCGEPEGAGVEVAAGICMPGMFPVSVFPGDGAAFRGCGGMCIPGMFMSCMFMPRMSCFFGAGRRVPFLRRVLDLDFDLDAAFRFAFGFDMSMPGMFCMSCPSCCARAGKVKAKDKAVIIRT